jgi:hypothetical protein
MKKVTVLLLMSFLLSGCVTTSHENYIPLGNNLLEVNISPMASTTRAEAKRMALEVAAMGTIEQGYDKFIVVEKNAYREENFIGGLVSQNSGSMNANSYSASGSFSGGTVASFGTTRRTEVTMVVKMFRYKDKGAEKAIDARSIKPIALNKEAERNFWRN